MGFKMSLSKLVRHLLQSREKWKIRSLKNQKECRRAKVNIRDLENSRNQWKERAKKAEDELFRAKKATPKKPTDASSGDEDTTKSIAVAYSDPPKWHSYSTSMIYMSINQVIRAYSGFRGGMRSLDIMSEVMCINTPSYSSIRLWCYRVGLFMLKRPLENCSDWIYIMDITVELGQIKCLLILGVHESKFSEGNFCLGMHDPEVLAVEILKHSTGDVVAECLERLSVKTGIPKQIVADQGSDLKKGIEIYQSRHAEVVYTPDLTHKIACIIKPMLLNDSVFQQFNTRCNQAKLEVQQTELNFLKPPTQRTKARYHHIAPRIEWAQKMLDYRDRGDFHLIDARYCLAGNLLRTIKLPRRIKCLLKSLNETVFNDISEFDSAMITTLNKDIYQQHQYKLRHLASIGRQRFEEKFGWLGGYESDLKKYQQMVDVIKASEIQLKHEGLHNESAQQFLQNNQDIKLDENAKSLQTQIVEYMNTNHGGVKPKQARLVSSDIIESIFGQFKQVGHSGCLQEIGKMVLLLPLLVMKITPDLVLQAMSSVKTSDVNEWGEKYFGISSLALRKSALSSSKVNLKSA
jgi:hypothetical protein